MSMDINKLKKLNELLTLQSLRKHKIVLNPNESYKNIDKNDDEVIIDGAKWNIPEKTQVFLEQLPKVCFLSTEEKIINVFYRLCCDYTYDDNVLSYMRKVDEKDYELPDWYGRIVGKEWENNRKKHNRRACYEVSRYLAKSLTEILKDDPNYDVCIFWDKGNTHYFVGLICDDYSLKLDIDDFNKIKDLTRAKAELTIEGIEILKDNHGKFQKALNTFNKDKEKHAILKIENEIADNSNLEKSEDTNSNAQESDDILFLRKAMQILVNKYQIDSQGLFEYLKEIVDMKIGPESRRKIWKRIDGTSKESTRYIRCLEIKIGEDDYIIDVDSKEIRTFNEKEFEQEESVYTPYKKLIRNWDDRYDGT